MAHVVWCLEAARYSRTSTLHLHTRSVCRIWTQRIFDHSIAAFVVFGQFFVLCAQSRWIVKIECTTHVHSWFRGQIVRRRIFFFLSHIPHWPWFVSLTNVEKKKQKKGKNENPFQWIEMKRFKEAKIRWFKKLTTAATMRSWKSAFGICSLAQWIHEYTSN